MSDSKTTLLVLGAGCAAMIGVAAAVVSTGSFFSDLHTSSAQAAAFQVTPRKVKTVSIIDKPAEKGPAVAQADRSSTSSVERPVRERSALHRANPRWAREASSGSASLSQRQAVLAAYADDETTPDNVLGGMGSPSVLDTQNDPFAMIVPPGESSEPTVELAGTVPLVPAPAPRDSVTRQPADESREAPKAATTGRALTGATTVNEAANMRSSPRSGSRVLMVVPDGARVSIAPGCEQWCEIAYNGTRGFVYKDFIGSGRSDAKPRARTENASADPLDKTIYGDSNFINSDKQSSRTAEKASTDEKTANTTAAASAKKQLFEPPSR